MEYLMSGSPRGYPPKSPLVTKELIERERERGDKTGTLLSQNRMTPQGDWDCGKTSTLPLGLPPTAPVVLPVFPVRPQMGPPPAPYSPSRFHFRKSCQHRCSWKCTSIALMFVVALLVAMLTYFAAVRSAANDAIGDATGCILVEDAKAVAEAAEGGLMHPTTGTPTPIVPQEFDQHDAWATSEPPSLASGINVGGVVVGNPSAGVARLGSDQWPVTEMPSLGETLKRLIAPFSFWAVAFRVKQPMLLRLNFSVPWGANLAVFGRRNVMPSVTQYDFVEFIRGGRLDRTRRQVRTVSFTPPFAISSRHIPDTKGYSSVNDSTKNSINSDTSSFVTSSRTSSSSSSSSSHRQRRSSSSDISSSESLVVNVTMVQYVDTGRWFVALYNDDSRSHGVGFSSEEAGEIASACPNDCTGHGSCYLGRCDCIDGYEGPDCSKSVCPVLCSNHGKYGGGYCHCEEGWKGAECDVPEMDCEAPTCSGHGHCVDGACVCEAGWKGPRCDQDDCADPSCSGHGTCVTGRCLCRVGWQGANCSVPDEGLLRCLPDCSGRGAYDLETGGCVCDQAWTGPDCSKAMCSLDCGAHGHCDGFQCICSEGWTGEKCEQRKCDSRCSAHGQCKNGTCVCSQGWNGKHCTLSGCPNSCGSAKQRGRCILENGEYHCDCMEGWAGVDCSVALEIDCTDDKDNDKDEMTDCSDSECCEHPGCTDSIMCLASNDPVEVLLRKQPPAVTASFYQRVKFLIEENSVQSYANKDEYSERRVAVIRGQVTTSQGLGIIGIRVSVDKDPRFGFTLTRKGGWFDVLVNGGGAITLQFQRSPFRPLTRTVFVPWNEIVVMDPVIISLMDVPPPSPPPTDPWTIPPSPADSSLSPGSSSIPASSGSIITENIGPPPPPTLPFTMPCSLHDAQLLRPAATSTYKPFRFGGSTHGATVFAENQILQESIDIPGSSLRLVYQSSQSSGYLSGLLLQVTRAIVPPGLRLVHIRIIIEGSVFHKTLEADPDLTYTFAWNKRNVYKQKVYGLATARVSIGYEYIGCQAIVWETQTAKLQGFDVDIAHVGSWNIDIHHHYNFHDGILQRGDGSTVAYKQFPRVSSIAVGTGQQRPLICEDCDGPGIQARLLTPIALAAGPDGSVYVGDFNLVRRLKPDGHLYTVLQLSATQVSYQYHLAVSPADGRLYISDPERRQVLRALELEPLHDPTLNFEAAVGSGERCVPGDETRCGDGGNAADAKLAHPKGLAIAADRTMYIADGTSLRAVDTLGIIHTLVGHQGSHSQWRPLPCSGSIPAQLSQLQWPTVVALSPLDGTLHILDDHLLLQLTSDLRLRVVMGTPLHCRPPDQKHQQTSAFGPHTRPQGLLLTFTFAPSGDAFLAESDSHKVQRLLRLDPSGSIEEVAGARPQCSCANGTCACSQPPSTHAQFFSVAAVAVAPDGVVYVADQGRLQVLALKHFFPEPDANGEYTISFPETDEQYVFNRYGQHITTRDLASGRVMYTFLYSKNTSFGRLSKVTDAAGSKVSFLRDYANVVSTIENPQGSKLHLKLSGVGALLQIQVQTPSAEGTPANHVSLEYIGVTGLLSARSNVDGETFLYRYDTLGRLQEATLPTGETLRLSFQLLQQGGIKVLVSKNEEEPVILETDYTENSLIIRQGLTEGVFRNELNGTWIWQWPWGTSLSMTSGRSEGQQLTLKRDETSCPAEWKVKVDEPRDTVVRELWVNWSRVATVAFERTPLRETLSDSEGATVLTSHWAEAGLPTMWDPAISKPGGAHSLNLTYDRFNRLETWRWGSRGEKMIYDRHGLVSEVTGSNGSSRKIAYNEWGLPASITLPSGRQYTYHYDPHGALRHITIPGNGKHTFMRQLSIGFQKIMYTSPGEQHPLVWHVTHDGKPLLVAYPGDSGRLLLRYDDWGRLSAILHGDGMSRIRYDEKSVPTQLFHSEGEMEYRWDGTWNSGLLSEERFEFGARTGLSKAKFTYTYDSSMRHLGVKGRVGGQSLSDFDLSYHPRTGALQQIGPFRLLSSSNETSVFDGTAIFSRIRNQYLQESQVAVTIHGMEAFRAEFHYDDNGRMSQARTYTRNVGVNMNMYLSVKNFSYDADGQLIGVEAQEPWAFQYDPRGNLLALSYRGNLIPMEYSPSDRLEKFGDGVYRYDSRGNVVQNAREERFQYNARGLLIRATKRGRFDVRYSYDHAGRLSARKDNFGNVTQFFYTDPERPRHVSHVYSPRDGKLMSLVYDDRGHLIFAQVYRHKYYIATDQCGTPVMVYNHYGEIAREMMRSPFGHIVYDSNPYLYLPVDFCGGLLDQVTSLVHLNSRMYDPLLGQWMGPAWNELSNNLLHPEKLHLFRLQGNDPLNIPLHSPPLNGHSDWLTRLGFRLNSLAPPLFETLNAQIPVKFPLSFSTSPAPGPSPPEAQWSSPLKVVAGTLSRLSQSLYTPEQLRSVRKAAVANSDTPITIATMPPPLGKGIVVVKRAGQVEVRSGPEADPIYRDVFSAVLRGAVLLDVAPSPHALSHDSFFFIKEETWRAHEDHAQLRRLAGQLNVTLHQREEDASGDGGVDLRLHGPHATLHVRYGASPQRERRHLLHHAKMASVRHAWAAERERLRLGLPPLREWASAEADEILKVGYASAYDGVLAHDPELFPELSDDPTCVRFVKRRDSTSTSSNNNRPGRSVDSNAYNNKYLTRTCWWLPWRIEDC